MFQSINPINQELLKEYKPVQAEELSGMIENSNKAFSKWKQIDLEERIQQIREIASDLRKNKITYATLLTLEMGKLKAEAEAEIAKCALLCDYYADNAPAFLKDKFLETEYDKSYVSYQPLGIILGIMPWNFPFWQSFRFTIPALLAGNTVLLKPAPNVPQSGKALADIFSKTLKIKDVFQTVFAQVEDIPFIINHKHVKGVSLTGSNRAGAAVAALSGAAIKKCLLELGGSDPFIVLEDADVKKAAQTGFASRMLNCGQTCISAKRFILHEKIAQPFVEQLINQIESLKSGNPAQTDTTLTAMARTDLASELQNQVDRSIAAGANVLYPGGQDDKDSNYFHPVILGDIKPGMPAYDEELFGPVFSIFVFKDEAEAVNLANDSIYGLGGSIWSEDKNRAEKIGLQLNVGAIAINDMVKSDPRLPFGGVNQSGFGRELALEGMLEFVNVKSVVVS